MVINENNSYINSFTKGMNSDLAYDQLPNVNYTYAKNIRITKNQLIGDSKEDYSSVHEGVVSPVYKGFDISAEENVEVQINGDILACDTVDTTGVIITREEKKLILYKFKIENDVIKAFDKWLVTKDYPEIVNLKAVSIVLYKELDNVIKAYIATGIWPMFTVRVDDDTEKYGEGVDIDSITNNRIMPASPIYIEKQISGLLKTSQVQYTYRFYNKYGITTRLAPLTNKIQVIDSNRNKEIGNAEDTATTIGFSLKINSDWASGFNRMLIYRIQYIKENEDANVYLIYDGNKQSTFNDVGVDALQELTMEEFSSLSGVQVIPKIIENNQDYMFAANVTDDTIIKGLKTKGGEIKQASTNICLAKGGPQMLPLTTGLNFRDGFGGNFISVKDDLSATIKVTDYLLDRNINPSLAKNTYNNIFTSSLLRSLRRGEKYKYGIIYYDKHGRRSDVIPIDSITIPDISNNIDDMSIINYQLSLSGYGTLMAKPVGVCITLPQPIKEDGSLVENIIGCQIVRRSSKDIYQKTLLLVALSRPMRQLLKQTSDPSESGIQSPYYPTGLLTSDHITTNGYYNYDGVSLFDAKTVDNKGLFQIFSSEIDFRREDTLNKVLQNDTYINPVQILYPAEEYNKLNSYERILALNASGRKQLNDAVKSGLYYTEIEEGSYDGSADHLLYIAKRKYNDYYGQKDKISDHLLYNYFLSASPQYTDKRNILTIADVKIPKWYEGFSNIQYNGAQIVGGIKQYKSYTTSLDEYSFNNWASSGLYDLLIWDQWLPNTWRLGDDYGAAQFLYDTDPPQRDYPLNSTDGDVLTWYTQCSKGFIGPGPSSLLVALEKSNSDMYTGGYPLGTYICNIEHNVEFQNSEPDEYVQYFGFGNYFKLVLDLSGTKYLIDHNYDELNDKMYVFDGDIYITPHEITTLYKTYDFNSKDTLESILITNYVPMESKVNTFFDYGMNYLNTQSTNLLYESGSITGVTSQNRPAHQYNMIYSNNDVSNDVFSLISTDEKETNTFPHRTYYSEAKVNGEFIDNFGIFKAASFIDVDSRLGEITELLTDKNTLYYWLTSGFGKFSVNERSLINDQNGNTIMLGLAGILSRFDYISTKYGMRPYDYCAIAAEGKIYWIDINNRAVVVGNTQDATNLGELLSVLNIINNNIDTDSIPDINYDILNNELLCRCLNDSELIVFNIKYNIPTSIYTRKYDKMIYIHNHMYGIYNNVFTKYNYLPFGEIKDQQNKYLTPIELQFVVNPSVSTTKVFDSQLIIPIKRSSYNPENVECRYFDNVYTGFETDIIDTNTNLIESHTDREGNIIYNIPRYGNTDYGNRMRGKWLKTYIKQEDLHEFFTISHIITKLRQSYS